ncbi:G8 domain-containing protein [Aureliella helgolandensis]|uniref:Hemolysin, chromosomal n=1 Tax=Aureliella helgolandensis TaxID=2527968 RepID=A0A518GE08_9BACT|nr:G8 domain-containing protein [Aureliella helgolandensis]QDV26829.1 Hemolysin, chromosomal [Aureliella helgolandensis]
MSARSLRIQQLESRRLLHGASVTDFSVVTMHDTIPRFAANAEFVAVRSGDWSDPLTWNQRRVPGVGATVQIPQGQDVDYDVNSHTKLDAIEVSGRLDFDPTVDTALWINEIMVMPHGTMTIGTADDSVAPSQKAEIVFTDSTPKTGTKNAPGEDIWNFGNGLIVLGTLELHGAAKTAFARATSDLVAGETALSLDAIPSDWNVGDQLVLPETSQTVIRKTEVILNESEVVGLAAISGTDVTLDRGFTFDHRGITENSFGIERFAHVGNLTRNIVLRSENPEGYRGHFMATADAQVTLKNVAFESMGRTSADRPVTNPLFNPDGSLFSLGDNQIARYPIHLHHLNNPFMIDGVVVNDALKWGIAVHGSDNGTVQNSIVFDSDGSAIVTEDGSEIGNKFLNNLVIKVDGGHQRLDGRAGAAQTVDALGNLFIEIGADGSGFWLRATAGTFVGNTVYDAAGYGYNFNGYYRVPAGPNGAAELHKQIELFEGNEAVSSLGGFWLTWSQGQHDILGYQRQIFDNFLAWHVQLEGVKAYHDANATLRNFQLINDPSVSNENEGSGSIFTARTNVGMWFGSESYENFNLRIEDARIENFNIGILAPVHAGQEGALLDGAFLRNYLNIAFDASADPNTFSYRNVEFAPSLVTRIAQSMPQDVTNLWHEDHGVLLAGTQSAELPPRIPASLPVKVDRRESGELRLTSGDTGDTIKVVQTAEFYEVSINGLVVLFRVQDLSRILFWGNGGDDTFVNETHLPLLAFGGSGNDRLVGGTSADTLIGEDGDDTLLGMAGDDLLYGGIGNDLLEGGVGRDKLQGEEGLDRLFGGLGDDWVLDGGAGDDEIHGDEGDDVLVGGDGQDRLYGGSGEDSLSGGNGDDWLFAGLGDDVLNGGSGNNLLQGDEGRDKLWGGIGDDELVYDLSDYVISGGAGTNRLRLT